MNAVDAITCRPAARTVSLVAIVGLVLLAFSMMVSRAQALPDNREYELVTSSGEGEPYIPETPLASGNSAFYANTSMQFRAATNGNGVAYAAEPSPFGGSGATGGGEGNQWLAFRSSAGWESQDITPASNPATGYEASLESSVFQSISASLDSSFIQSLFQPFTAGVERGCNSLYVRSSSSGALSPLFERGQSPENCGHPLFAGASAGEDQIIFQSEAGLTAGSEEATEVDLPPGRSEHSEAKGSGCVFGCNLYEVSGGKLQMINEIEGKQVPSATFGGYPQVSKELTDFSNTISADGSKIFWTDTETGPDMEHVYVHEDGTNVAVSVGAAEYWTATPDGRYAYYTEGGQLWRFDTETRERLPLTGSGAEVQGVVGTNQTGEDGAYVYFVANGVLTDSANSHGDRATQGECPAPESESSGCNLYLLHDGTVAFIAGLAGVDDSTIATSQHAPGGAWRSNLGERTSEVTPDGGHLVFESVRELTGYEANPELREMQVFVYDAEEAKLKCASCSPTGSASVPIGGEPHQTKLLVGDSEDRTYMHRWISADGARVFFNSRQPLVSQDTNGLPDVYEWERPAGPGEPDNTCTAAQASPTTGGCTFLLSGGIDKFPSLLVDADENGQNVFFEHIGPIGQAQAPIDDNELYDARVNGGFPQMSLACTGTGCQGVPPAPPIFATPSSVTFAGVGNFPLPSPSKVSKRTLTRTQRLAKALKACRRDRSRKVRGSCEKSARKRYAPGRKVKTSKAKASYKRRVQL